MLAQGTTFELPNKNAARRFTVVADGAKDPHLISDTRAYTHFIRALMGAGTGDAARRDALLTRVGLGDADKTALTEVPG